MRCTCDKQTIFKDTTSLIGKRFGRLIVLERDINRPHGRGNPSY